MQFKTIQILEDIGFFEKRAGVEDEYEAITKVITHTTTQGAPSFGQQAKSMAIQLGAMALAMGGVNALVQWRNDKAQTADIKKAVENLSLFINQDTTFTTKEEKQKATARLYEIARTAPHVCLNREIVLSLIKSRLHTGITPEDRQRLALIQAQYSKEPSASRFIPKLASADIGSIIADAYIIKTAAGIRGAKVPSKTVEMNSKVFAALTLAPLLASVVGGTISHALKKVKEKKLSAALDESFVQAMSLSNPEKEPLFQNKTDARRAFNTLASFAPQVALDPQAARTFMVKIVDYDKNIDTSTLKELSEISRNLNQSFSQGGNSFSTGFLETGKYLGGYKSLDSTLGKLTMNGVPDVFGEDHAAAAAAAAAAAQPAPHLGHLGIHGYGTP